MLELMKGFFCKDVLKSKDVLDLAAAELSEFQS